MQISGKLEIKSQHRGGFYLKPQNVALDVLSVEQMQPALV